MPRLTDQTYLSNYDALRDGYLRGGQSFIRLDPHEQWALFGFYQHHEWHSRKELLSYRREISRLNPSLPQRAGKAFQHWQQLRNEAVVTPTQVQPAKRRNSTDFSLAFQVRPEPDVKLLAHAIIQVAKLQNAERAARGDYEDDPPSA